MPNDRIIELNRMNSHGIHSMASKKIDVDQFIPWLMKKFDADQFIPWLMKRFHAERIHSESIEAKQHLRCYQLYQGLLGEAARPF